MIPKIHTTSPRFATEQLPTLADHICDFVASLPWKPILQRLPGTMLLFICVFTLYAPWHAPWTFTAYYTFLSLLVIANSIRTFYGVYTAYTHSKAHSMTDWYAKLQRETGASAGSNITYDLRFDEVMHIIVIPNYKETMDTLCETLDVLCSHRRALKQYKVCLAMEESEIGSSEKALTLLKLYGEFFYEITYTIHPKDRSGEIRGKSSNVAWATRQMANRGGMSHDHEIVTIMDADTAFAEDYFTAMTYHYISASPEKRRFMMFAPCTVFDRNAKNVPMFVRITDMSWSIGVISNLYPNSPVKIPCSAYSVSMDLGINVGFWDAGPEAIGEDMHMYLKCFFSTNGQVIVKTIYSPASQCNVEGQGSGIFGYVDHLKARYVQGKRHLWGTLDFGYTLRRTLMSFIKPDKHVVSLKHSTESKLIKRDAAPSGIPLPLLLSLLHRICESHVLIGHFLIMIWILSYTGYPDHIALNTVRSMLSYLQLPCSFATIAIIYYYEKYHQWVGFDRWKLQDKSEGLRGRRTDSATDLTFMPAGMVRGYDRPKVQYLGLRPSLSSPRQFPLALFDWLATPVAGYLYYMLPQVHAQLSHLWTDRLEYTVACKPTLNRPGGNGCDPSLPSYTPLNVEFNENVVVETCMRHHDTQHIGNDDCQPDYEPEMYQDCQSSYPSAASISSTIVQTARTPPPRMTSGTAYTDSYHLQHDIKASASLQPLRSHHVQQLPTPASSTPYAMSASSSITGLARIEELEVKSNDSSKADEGYFEELDCDSGMRGYTATAIAAVSV